MKYTRKQIVEAIRHWQNVLKTLDESKSHLLTQFENAFGVDDVYSTDKNIDITLKNATTIYDILNEHFFLGKLTLVPGKIDLFCDSCLGITRILHSSFGAPLSYSISDRFALFMPKLQWLQHKETRKIALTSLRNGIFINLDYGNKAVLPYLISTICHEMIHCYDCLYGHLLRMTADLINIGCDEDEISYESHFTPIFKQKSDEMKTKNGITINITADNKSFDELNKQAADEIQILKESDDLSNYKPIIFSDEFKKKYSKLMKFCDDGSVLLSFS